MGDWESVIPPDLGEKPLISAAKYIVKALGSKKKLTYDERKALAELRTQLATMTALNETKDDESNEMADQLNAVEEKIMSWEEDQSMIWDSGPEEASVYLNAAAEAQKLAQRLGSVCQNNDDEEYKLLQRAHNVLQKAMERLEEEFRHILVENRQPFEPEHVSFRSVEEDLLDKVSIISFGDESVEESLHRDSVSRAAEEYITDLVHPDAIPELKCIANLMFNSNYDQECCQAYTSVRKDVLDECLFNLEMEKLSIEDVLRMEWVSLNSKIKRWVRTMKIFVRVYLASEKWLSDQIFGELGSVALACFIEASKASMLQLLNFGGAVSIGPHQPEKLSCILCMYEALSDLLPDIDGLYSDDDGSSVRIECHEVLGRLGDAVRAAFLELKNGTASNTSTTPFPGGGIHHLTRYVMNYLKILTDYSETLNFLLEDHDEEDPSSLSPDESPMAEEESKTGNSSRRISPMARHFRSLASILQSNLDDKSKLYKDASLQHFFLMNNIHYMAEKVKGSELRHIFGDKWIRKHNWKFQQHAMNYERASWSSILSLLKDDGIQNPGSSSTSRALLKERIRSFYLAFEEIYKTQTGWFISDSQLREDLRISTSLKVIQAYRTFVGRYAYYISDKHMKYSADDLESYILDLFEGSSKSLPNFSRR
ncbi:Exocyst complex component EXO70B1 [Morella rubra]|uniref:Exocyst subunit Exo70 family protein n=1 Tax=Morella rubra TaxID=262757 RepID=A0A6A1VFL7_9ROSI|nr:Exocyst complex component EXO70B1 [Morella rubra]